MKINIYIATHKEYVFPKDSCYIPIQVGAAIYPALPYVGDHTGQNISEKNKNYCELTALYWVWKNAKADFIGLCHYRRYFKGKKGIATEKEIEHRLSRTNTVLPKKRHYLIETNYSQYIHAHHAEDLELTRRIILKKYPEYIDAWEKIMTKTKGHRFNMLIMKQEVLNNYCEWLFDILFELEKQLDISAYSDYDSRVFGFVAERLLDIWLEKERISYSEMAVYETEHVNWVKKIGAFLWRKVEYYIKRKK